ncbi:MAG: PIN domain-containing protein [Spirochaetaceae bacterium]|jgi:predicted nucleic acid-binding protein|nr:PIN domain-containing protein [Spirochaetaceae bacterium]
MSDLENGNNPNVENKNSIQLWENIAKYKCKSSETILTRDRQIEQNKIRPNDALHIACAIESQCEYFITTDEGLTNKKLAKRRKEPEYYATMIFLNILKKYKQ